jgi:hypothetical protein
MYKESPCPCNNKYRVVTTSHVRFLHASPDSQGVDVYVNNIPIERNLTYKEFTKYFPLAGGLYNIKVYPSGQSQNPLINRNVNIPPRTIFTLAVSGMKEDLELFLAPEPQIQRFPQETYVRFIHLSPNAPSVDIFLATGAKLFEDVEYKEITNYMMMRPGVYEFQFKETGTNNMILQVPNANLRAGNIYTIYIVGLEDGRPPLQVLIPLDGGSYITV